MTYGMNYTAIVGGEAYIEWACFSAKTAKMFMPKIRTSLYTNRRDLVENCEWGKYIDDILQAPDYPPIDLHGAMISGILASKELGYDVTLFTGAEAVLCDDMTEMFDLMATGNFDLAVVQPQDQRKRPHSLRGVYPGFPWHNDGTLLFPWNDATVKFFEEWRERFNSHKIECPASRKKDTQIHPSQPSFNEALYHNSNLRLVFLSHNYNAQLWTGCLYGKAKIVHVHGAGGKKAWELAQRFNANWEQPRLFRDRKILKEKPHDTIRKKVKRPDSKGDYKSILCVRCKKPKESFLRDNICATCHKVILEKGK